MPGTLPGVPLKPDAKEDGVSHPEAAQPLVDFVPTKKYFVGIDSDGCAMDAMDIKHQECFTPCSVSYTHLTLPTIYSV